jgi:hypothetical protein
VRPWLGGRLEEGLGLVLLTPFCREVVVRKGRSCGVVLRYGMVALTQLFDSTGIRFNVNWLASTRDMYLTGLGAISSLIVRADAILSRKRYHRKVIIEGSQLM